ncbi:hypothetical protein AMK27_19750 [Streptomyces sp. CB02009]|uniref:hypothetical protein n=1 Tax=Streptomyces sp. CB02009 TaxID=1703938 RepID=UPI000939F18F|nr:hypothetical protein [Streptomyces sp. CB02009]OKJ59727.1 hypothetical protein AMK27_19750 [Streptomyces sp. CB02009]
MRPLATRRITALAISAVITLGTAGPAIAGEHHPTTAAERAARAPLPDVAALLAQAEALGELGSVTTPVTELVTAALKADSGQLPAVDAEALKAEIAAAVEEAKATAPAPLPDAPVTPPSTGLPVTPPSTDLPVTPPSTDLPVTPPAAELPVTPPVTLPVAADANAAWAGKAAAPADVVDDALATVEKAVAALLAAVTSGDAGGVVPQVTATLTSLVNLAVSTVLGSGLPAPDLAGLPALPALPVTTPELPAAPPELPAAPPAAVPELPAAPALPVR